MQLTLILFPIALAIYGAIIYLFVLLVKALRKYIKSKDVREEKKAVCRSLGEALKAGERHVRPQHVESLRAREALRHPGRRTAA